MQAGTRQTLKGLYWLAALGLLQFVNVPLLGDIHYAGKAFFFVLAVLLAVVVFGLGAGGLAVSRLGIPLLVLWFCFLAAAIPAHDTLTAFLTLAVFSSVLLYWLVFTNLIHRYGFGSRFLGLVQLVGVAAASLGLYQAIHFRLHGTASEALIPFLLLPLQTARVSGVYGQPNLFALLLLVSMLVFIYRHLHDADFGRSRFGPALSYLPLLLCCWVFFLTGSRAGHLALALSLGALGIYYWRGANRAILCRAELVRLGLVLVSGYLLYKGTPLLDLFSASEAGGAAVESPFEAARLSDPFLGNNMGLRYLCWLSSLLMVGDFPLFGVGLDNYKFLLPGYLGEAHDLLGVVGYEAMRPTWWAHNELLQVFAEAGLVAGVILFLLLLLLLRQTWKLVFGATGPAEPLFLYSHLFLLPFVVHGLFSWPFRYLPLLALFFSFLGLLCAQYPMKEIRPGRGTSLFVRSTCILGIALCCTLLVREGRIGAFKAKLLSEAPIEQSLDAFDRLYRDPYSQYTVLFNALPIYVNHVQAHDDAVLAQALIPHGEKVVDLQGTFSQWYNLALLYGAAGRLEEARSTIKKAIDLQPAYQPAWQYQHHLNMLEVSRVTGRPFEELVPKKGAGKRNIQEMLDGSHIPFQRQ